MQTYIRPSDYRQLARPISPLFAFLAPWIVVLIGQQMALCKIIIPVYSSFYFLILANICSALCIAFVMQTFFPYPLVEASSNLKKLTITKKFKQATFLLIYVYLFFQIGQIFYFKGFPLLWIVTGNLSTYFEFGIGSLNGLLNAIYLLSTSLLFLIYLREKQIKQLALFFFLLTIPLLLISRQLLISVFLQTTCCLLICHPKKIKVITVTFIILLLIFVFVGNMRTGVETLTAILGPEDYIPKSLYSLLWIYAYIVTPFNNINAAIDSITPVGTPHHEISSLVPSIFRSVLGEGAETGYSLVNEQMTVSSFYLPLILDFGQIYAFFFMAAFQFILFVSYRRAVSPRSWIDVIEYSILYMVMMLSIFSNLLLYLPIAAQLVLIRIAKWRLNKQNGVFFFSNNRFASNPLISEEESNGVSKGV